MNTQLKTSNIHKSFGRQKVLKGVSMEIPKGSVYGLLGRNGAGKTTLFRILANLLNCDSGTFQVGSEASGRLGTRNQEIGYVSQGEILPGWCTVEYVVRLESRLKQRWDDTKLQAWLRHDNVDKRTRMSALSVGQRKRLELAIALAGRPSVLLFDEPFSGMDPVSRSSFIEHCMDQVAADDMTVLISSHVVNDLERLCDRVGFLASGALAFDSELDELKEEAAILKTHAGASIPPNIRAVSARERDGETTYFIQKLDYGDGQALLAEGFDISRPTLEELSTELLQAFAKKPNTEFKAHV